MIPKLGEPNYLYLYWILCNSPKLDLRKGDSNGPESPLPHTVEPRVDECSLLHGIKPVQMYVWTDRLIVNAQVQKQVIHINLLQYLLTPLLA